MIQNRGSFYMSMGQNRDRFYQKRDLFYTSNSWLILHLNSTSETDHDAVGAAQAISGQEHHRGALSWLVTAITMCPGTKPAQSRPHPGTNPANVSQLHLEHGLAFVSQLHVDNVVNCTSKTSVNCTSRYQSSAPRKRSGFERHPWWGDAVGAAQVYLTRCVYWLFSESQLPHKTVDLISQLVIVNNNLTILRFSWLSETD